MYIIPQILDQPVCLTIYFMFYNCMLEKKSLKKSLKKSFNSLWNVEQKERHQKGEKFPLS